MPVNIRQPLTNRDHTVDEFSSHRNSGTEGIYRFQEKAGTKFVVGIGQVPRKICSVTDLRFTLLPFTAASGDAVLFVVIFQGKGDHAPASWASGIDI